MELDFYKDIYDSHPEEDMSKYLSIIYDIFHPPFIFSWELSNMKYPFDLQFPFDDKLKSTEVKNVDYSTDDVALEQYTDTDKKVRGWTHYLDSNGVDYILFSWKNSEYYALIDASILCDWWIMNCYYYELRLNKVSRSGNSTWQSSFSYVPIDKLPKECRIKINTEYLKENINE